MNFTKFDLKNICDFENELKDELKAVKKELPLVFQKYESQMLRINRLQAASLVLFGLNLIVPGNKTMGNIFSVSLYLILCFSKWLEELKTDIEYKYLFDRRDNLDETIDAIELLKDFLRNKKISVEEKIFIIERLYLTYGDNLKDVILDVEEANGTKLQLTIEKK